MVNTPRGKTVLVTGANSGIGAAIVRAFARYGARIALHYLETAHPVDDPHVRIGHTLLGRAGAETVAEDVRRMGAAVALFPADLADPNAIATLFDASEAAL